jgi:hypothetical protein
MKPTQCGLLPQSAPTACLQGSNCPLRESHMICQARSITWSMRTLERYTTILSFPNLENRDRSHVRKHVKPNQKACVANVCLEVH